MKLLIVESPNKIKKIEGILGKGHKVMASCGHIMDLESKTMSVDIKDKFRPQYTIINNGKMDKTKIVKDLKSNAKKASEVIIATDGDREGEMIGWSIANVLGLKNPKRIVFTEVTKKGLTDALKNVGEINNDMVDAQKARRILDRIIGYELSPLLFNYFKQRNLSAGRVQSVIARLIIDREEEIKKFMEGDLKTFFKFNGIFKHNSKEFVANLYDLEGKTKDGYLKGNISKIGKIDGARDFLNKCIKTTFIVDNVFDKKRIQNPHPPFNTFTLQQEASRKFGFTGKRTMSTAQKLYEAGYITYMRTDSICLSDEALDSIEQYVKETYGEEYNRRFIYKAKSNNTQEAHEAIRPSDITTEKIECENNMGPDEVKLYSLIWKRTVASQMKPAEFNVTSIQIVMKNINDYFFMTNIENMIFPGYLIVYNVGVGEDDSNGDDVDTDKNTENCHNKNMKIPKKGDSLNVSKIEGTQEYDKPIGRYDYASLTNKLSPDGLNLTRPATVANFIDVIIAREYVKIGDCDGKTVKSSILTWVSKNNEIKETSKELVIGKEKKKYMPTHLGTIIINYLVDNFPNVMDYHFTAQMEEKLDDIANGKLVWHEVLKEFYDDFHPTVMSIKVTNGQYEDKNARMLGVDPHTGFEIYATILKNNPVYKMICTENGKVKLKFASIREPLTIDICNLENALESLKFPKELGIYQRKKVVLKNGSNGLYVECGDIKRNVDTDTITIDEAIDLIQGKNIDCLKKIETSTKIYLVVSGPHSVYLKMIDKKTCRNINMPLPKNENIDNLTLERINEIICNKTSGSHDKTAKTTKTSKIAKTAKTVKTAKTAKIAKSVGIAKTRKTAKNIKVEINMDEKQEVKKVKTAKIVKTAKTTKSKRVGKIENNKKNEINESQ